jgi:hypothetical protein
VRQWGKAEPGDEVYVECGRVWFTVSVGDWDPAKMPTKTGVAANVAAITAGALVFGLAGVGVAGLISGKLAMRRGLWVVRVLAVSL